MSNKIFIVKVWEGDYDGDCFIKAFSTREIAESYLKETEFEHYIQYIEEVEVDNLSKSSLKKYTIKFNQHLNVLSIDVSTSFKVATLFYKPDSEPRYEKEDNIQQIVKFPEDLHYRYETKIVIEYKVTLYSESESEAIEKATKFIKEKESGQKNNN